MMECLLDTFDSALLGRRVVKLWLKERDANAAELQMLCEREQAEIITCFTPYARGNIETLEKLGFTLISIRNTYERRLEAPTNVPDVPPGYRAWETAMPDPPCLEQEDILNLARTIGETSRYFKDERIPRDCSMKLYVAWLTNSLYHGRADGVILLIHGTRLVGLHTVTLKGTVGAVDLIGVLPEVQMNGLGHLLLERGVELMRKRRMKTVRVVTEGENIAATRFYQKHGFLLSHVELVYHKHAARM